MTFWNFVVLLAIYVPLIMLWVFTLTDLARRQDLSGIAKGLWAVAVVLLPLVGMLVYFIARPDDADAVPDAGGQPADAPGVVISPDRLDELARLGDLRDSGAITDEEFATLKAGILSP